MGWEGEKSKRRIREGAQGVHACTHVYAAPSSPALHPPIFLTPASTTPPGVASYLLPLVGEVGDLGWAPASAILVKALYGSNVLASMGFIEEVVPGGSRSWSRL